MVKAVEKLTQRLPYPLRAAALRAETLWTTGAWRDPLALIAQWPHRHAYQKLQKAFFYHRVATAVLLGHRLGLYDLLDQRSRTQPEVADATGAHPRAADALLRILQAAGFVEESGGVWKNAGFTQLYLTRTGTYTHAPMLDLMAAQAGVFDDVVAGMRTGRLPPQLDIFSTDSRYREFLAAVNSYLDWAGRDLLYRVRLPEIRSFIVGSMGVSFSALVMERFPDARVTYGCLEHLVKEIPRLRQQYGVPADRVDGMHEHSGEPEGERWGTEDYDLVFLTKKMILEPEARIGERFATKALSVLRPGGVCIFWETIHTDGRPTPIARAMEAVLDLSASPTGLVNTESRLRRMLGDIGFVDVQIIPCLMGQTTFVVARRPASD